MADEIIPKQEVEVEVPVEPVSESVQVLEPQTAQIPVNEPLPTPTEIEAEPITETIPTDTKPVETEIQSEPTPELITEPEVKSEPISESATEEVKSELVKTESKPVEIISETKLEPVSEPQTILETKPEPKQETEQEQPKPIPEVIPTIAIIPKSKSLARELLVKARNMIQFRKRKKLDKIMTLFAKQTKITNDEVEKFLHISDATAGRYLATLVKEGKIKRNRKTGKSVFYTKI